MKFNPPMTNLKKDCIEHLPFEMEHHKIAAAILLGFPWDLSERLQQCCDNNNNSSTKFINWVKWKGRIPEVIPIEGIRPPAVCNWLVDFGAKTTSKVLPFIISKEVLSLPCLVANVVPTRWRCRFQFGRTKTTSCSIQSFRFRSGWLPIPFVYSGTPAWPQQGQETRTREFPFDVWIVATSNPRHTFDWKTRNKIRLELSRDKITQWSTS